MFRNLVKAGMRARDVSELTMAQIRILLDADAVNVTEPGDWEKLKKKAEALSANQSR
jgi:hypothetical protein